ncbi:hypothetical protein HAX54_004325 [Datura stramonium]|uniref:Uncharacterized protein n=1 Tax=Datura stramonium TaxID=4076 RepID=A0ABS8RHM1_DATST|nr:hypothetical protein [Datura stramonium]
MTGTIEIDSSCKEADVFTRVTNMYQRKSLVLEKLVARMITTKNAYEDGRNYGLLHRKHSYWSHHTTWTWSNSGSSEHLSISGYDVFVKAYAGAWEVETHKKDIFKRKQQEGNLLWSFMPALRDPGAPKLSTYNFSISPVDLVSALINIKEARFPKEIYYNQKKGNIDLWCNYHNTHGHLSGDYKHFWIEVAQLLKVGHLKEFLGDRAKHNLNKN